MGCCYRIDCVSSWRDLHGAIVISKCGRDTGKPGVVVGAEGEHFLLVADGKKRTAAKPKKKNIKHLIYTGFRICETGGCVTDRTIRRELAAFGGCAREGRPNG